MKIKRQTPFRFIAVLVLLTGIACDLGGIIPRTLSFGRSQPEEVNRRIFEGITYSRSVRNDPRPMVIHFLEIDLNAAGLDTLVTPGDPNAERPLQARTTEEFLTEFNLQVAINGDGFTPWYDLGPLGYAPKSGQSVAPNGFAMSRGVIYAPEENKQPILYIYRNNFASIGNFVAERYNAIAGNVSLVAAGDVVGGLNNSQVDPRTAIGIDRIGQRMLIIIIDGRQSGYSEGATMAELAKLFLERNIYSAINLDGGGSSSLVIQTPNGPEVLNSPVHGGVPGNLRPVGNHLGFWANP